MKQYLDLIREIKEKGFDTEDRTGTGTKRLFAKQIEFDISNNKIPIITTKKVYLKAVIHELIWFLSGKCDRIDYLKNNNIHIWDEWADEHGRVGDIYGVQWRRWYDSSNEPEPIDQIANLIKRIKEDPTGRRHILSAWNVGVIELGWMALPPCHMMAQFFVQDNKLSCMMYQRSGDMFLGVSFNITSYSILTHMIAKECGLETDKFYHIIGDAHIYKNHFDQVDLQLTREPFEQKFTIELAKDKNIDTYTYDDVKIIGYDREGIDFHPTIKGEISV